MSAVYFSILLLLFGLCSPHQETRLDQKEGLIQKLGERHVEFESLGKFEPDLNQATISRITKITIQEDKVFILDERQSRIYVFDRRANYLYSVGRPGQGPGDLEYPSDFFISGDGIIYVLNPVAKRIEIFTLKGEFIKRLSLELPKEIFYSQPRRILVDRSQRIFIAYNLSPHLIDIYNGEGIYLQTLLRREDELFVPGENVGNSSEIEFFLDENTILHFNSFTGVFTKVEASTGRVKGQFSAFDAYHRQEVEKIEEEVSVNRKEKVTGIQIKGFKLWSNFCVSDHNIYAFLLLKKKDEKQKMFVFSSDGDLLYWEHTPGFAGTRIDNAYFYQGTFVFKTFDDNVYLSKKKEEKK